LTCRLLPTILIARMYRFFCVNGGFLALIDSQQLIIFGEVLIDRFDNGLERRGGAPFNVAWHLCGFGLSPLFISRVGDDADGWQLLADMRAWGLATSGVGVDAAQPTGFVSVRNADTDPSYDIHHPVAYDFIRLPEQLPARTDIWLYHGSLALRHAPALEAFAALRNRISARQRCFDVNLRPPWWRAEDLQQNVHGATLLKCNADELAILASALHLNEPRSELFAAYDVEQLLVTRGADGADLYLANGEHYTTKAAAVADFRNSVGAGDAFAAVLLLAQIKRWPMAQALSRAAAFAAGVCSLSGAVSDERTFYRKWLQLWQ
jgi:fructokinase